jgi:hypothetical protein
MLTYDTPAYMFNVYKNQPSRQTGSRNLMGPKMGTYMKLVTKYQISAFSSCWEKCDEKCAYMFNVYKNQLSRQTGSRNLTGLKTLPTILCTNMKIMAKYQISAINSCWEKCDEKLAYMFNMYKNQQSRQTGSRNLMDPKTLPTIWGTHMKLVTKYQIPVINICWEKCDEKCAYMLNVYKSQLSRQTGSRNLTGQKTLPTKWGTYMKLVTKYQISAINICWEKNAMKNVHICSMWIKINKVGKQEVGIWWVQKRFPRYGIPIWSLWPNIRFVSSIVAEKNAMKNEHICSMWIKINSVGKQEVGIWRVQKRYPQYGIPIWSL